MSFDYDHSSNVPGLRVMAAYGAYPEHTLYFVVEADDYAAVSRFLMPGFKRCNATITPVLQFLGK